MLSYIVYFCVSIILGIVLLFLSIINFKIRINYYHSYKQIYFLYKNVKNLKSNKKILLFHAASAGEYEQIKPILRGIDRTQFLIVQSFTSPSIYNQKDTNPLYDIKCYHPFDIIWLSYLFFKVVRPNKYIITRHDIWPGHILMANYFNISTYFVNANIHQNSIWYKKSIRLVVRYLFNKIHCFIVPSHYISENIKLILSCDHNTNIHIIQDTRFNQISYLKTKNPFVNQIDQRNKVITFGSMDKSDEQIIFNILPQLIKKKNIILVPHEVDIKTISRIERRLLNASLSYNKFSEVGLDFSNGIILVDILGVLAQLYSLGLYAYVGGGFTRGVHSVLEPAVHGCCIACGPNIEMLDEAKLLLQKGSLQIINNSEELFLFINQSNTTLSNIEEVPVVADDMINILINNQTEILNSTT